MKHLGGKEFQFGGGVGLDACAAAAAAGDGFPLVTSPAARIEGGGDDPLSSCGGRRDAAAPSPFIVDRATVARLVRDYLQRGGSIENADAVADFFARGGEIVICPSGGRGLHCLQHALLLIETNGEAEVRRIRAARAGRRGGRNSRRLAAMALPHRVLA